jgi:hypothetical protein
MQVRCDIQSKKEEKRTGVVHDVENPKNVETSRIITGKGSVIRYLKNGAIEIMHANGNFAEFNPKNQQWTSTNNLGKRRGRKVKDGQDFDVEPKIPCNVSVDPETSARIMIREDFVLSITYTNGSVFTQHHDGTKFLVSADGRDTIIEKQGFAPVKVIFDTVKARANTIIGLGGTDALMGFDDIIERSCDGRICETFLPDGCVVQTYRERQELEGFNNFSTNTVHLFRRADLSVIKVKQDGEVVVITSNERAYLNEVGKQLPLG